MKKFSLRRSIAIAIAVLGTAMTALAILATRLGIDHNNAWGPRRVAVFVIGVFLFSLSALLWTPERVSACLDNWKGRIGRFLSHLKGGVLNNPIVRLFVGFIHRVTTRFKAAIYDIPFVKSLVDKFRDRIPRIARSFRNSPAIQYLFGSKENRAKIASWSLFAVIVLTYVWLVSVGRWTDWPATTDYYEMLANAFHHGQVHLMIDPDPRLLELPDPYDYETRKDIPIPWDVVLYEGKFYLYWGPAPGLITAGLRLFIPVEIGDEYLVFGFVTGLLFFSVLLILAIWRELYQDLPWWVVIPGILVAGLGNPIPWLLTRPAVYEVAIASGQFFLVAGIYWAFTALQRAKPVKWRLALAGIGWAFAMGSRITLAIAIVFMMGMVCFEIYRRTPKARRLHTDICASTALLAPLVLGVIGLGLYNYVRFGSMVEFGHRYQLTRENFYLEQDIAISGAYIIHNLYNYLLNSFRFLPVFPFVKPIWGKLNIWPFNIWASRRYHVEQVAGVLKTTPYVWFTLISILILLRHIHRRRNAQSDPLTTEIGSSERWLMTILIGAVILEFLPLLVFLSTTMRYLADFIPTLMLLSTVGSYQGYRMTLKHTTKHKAFLAILFLTALISVLLGFLLSITGYDARLENLNPELFEKIESLLAW